MRFLPKWRLRKPAEDARTVYVSEQYGVRSLHIGSDTVQSAMRLARPHDLELSYTRAMVGCLLFVPEPKDVLMIGLGGGSVAKFLRLHYPQTRICVIEIDPQVVAIARQCFAVPAEDPRFSVIVCDGAEYISRPAAAADLIMVDGYDAESQAKALATTQFYRDCRQRLAQGGMLVANLWGGDREFSAVLKRIGETFPEGTLCLPARKQGNVIVLAFRDPPGPLRWDELGQRAAELERVLDMEFPEFVAALHRMNRCDDEYLYP